MLFHEALLQLFCSKPPIRPPANFFTEEEIGILMEQIKLADQRNKLQDKFDKYHHCLETLVNRANTQLTLMLSVYTWLLFGTLCLILIPPPFPYIYVFYKALFNHGFRALRGISCHNFLRY